MVERRFVAAVAAEDGGLDRGLPLRFEDEEDGERDVGGEEVEFDDMDAVDAVLVDGGLSGLPAPAPVVPVPGLLGRLAVGLLPFVGVPARAGSAPCDPLVVVRADAPLLPLGTTPPVLPPLVLPRGTLPPRPPVPIT